MESGDLAQVGALLHALKRVLLEHHPDQSKGYPTKLEYAQLDGYIASSGFNRWTANERKSASDAWYGVLTSRFGTGLKPTSG